MQQQNNMKKFIYHLLVYIGLSIAVFNPKIGYSANIPPLPFEQEISEQIANYDNNKPLIKADNEFVKLFVVLYLIDKLYPEEKINDNIVHFLHRMWPQTKLEKLEKIAPFIKTAVKLKRRYVYTTEKLEQKIKATALLLKDAPIIAKDNEYAPKYSNQHKKTGENEYAVHYTPYKYLGYDRGEYGEPVRRRDKNYEPLNNNIIEELTLALLHFNIRDFYRALKKLPLQNDGSREKLVELENGLRSRLLVDTAALGNKEIINGVLEVYVPTDWYINGDYLNPSSKPHFILNEDPKEDLNISKYELYYPLAYEVINNQETARILINNVKFPIQFYRRDLTRDMNINGSFSFQLCRAKTKDCHNVISHNNLSIEAAPEELSSMHTNFVMQAFAHLPPEQLEHVHLKSAIYDPESKKLTIKFQTSKTYNNVAVMAEDSAQTNFFSPQYTIKKDEISVTFKAAPTINNAATNQIGSSNTLLANEIAISAAFDEKETIRTVTTPQIAAKTTHYTSKLDYGIAFLFGLLLNLMPGVFYLLQRLISLLTTHPNSLKILHRYALGSLIGIALLALYNQHTNWCNIYVNPWITCTAFLLAISYLTHLLGYMDFNLFRPLKGTVKRGYFIGLCSVILAAAIPTPYKEETFNHLLGQPFIAIFALYLTIWLGLLTIPMVCYFFRRRLIGLPFKMHLLNGIYMMFYLLIIYWIVWMAYHWTTLLTLLIFGLLLASLWYIYPLAIIEATNHRRSLTEKEKLFDKVQQHTTIAVIILWLTCGLLISIKPPRDENIPTWQEITPQIEEKISQNKPYLVVFNAYWAPSSWLNHNTISHLPARGITVASYTPSAKNSIALAWYEKYQKSNAPLHILFTSRHPQGLILPTDLRSIDWEKATSDFTINKKPLRKE